MLSFHGLPVLHTPTYARRLIAVASEDQKPLASIVLNYRKTMYGDRPINVGRTLLFNPNLLLPEANRAHLLKTRYRSFLPYKGGGLLSCNTFPFAEQDSERHRCIDVSLWCALDYMSRYVGTPRIPIGMLRPTELREQNHLGPVPGLWPDEVVRIIAAAGLAPAYYFLEPPTEGAKLSDNKNDNAMSVPHIPTDFRLRFSNNRAQYLKFLPFLETLHSYLDSQLPVVLVLGRFQRDEQVNSKTNQKQPVLISEALKPHSVCLIGHTSHVDGLSSDKMDRNELGKYIDELGFVTTTMYIDDFIVHDDDIGPYMLLSKQSLRYRSLSNPWSISRNWFESIEDSVIGMFVALPPEVRMAAVEARNIVQSALTGPYWKEIFDKYWEEVDGNMVDDNEIKSLIKTFRQARDADVQQQGKSVNVVSAHNNRLVVSIFLEHSSRLKHNVLTHWDEYSENSRKAYLDHTFPKYLWVAEISTIDHMSKSVDNKRILGEILIDSTQSRNDWSLISIRLPGLHFFRGVTGDIEYSALKDFGWFWSTMKCRTQWTQCNFHNASLSRVVL